MKLKTRYLKYHILKDFKTKAFNIRIDEKSGKNRTTWGLGYRLFVLMMELIIL